MQIIKEEQVNPCLTTIEIEILRSEFEPSIDVAYKEASKKVNVPGFRKGKAPRFMLQSLLEPQYVVEIAAENFVSKNFDKIIEVADKKPFAQVTFDVLDANLSDKDANITMKFNIPLEPVVTLGDYKGIEVTKYTKEVSDEDIEKQLEEIIAQQTKISPILDRPVAEGDTLFIEQKDLESEEPGKPARYIVGQGVADMDKALIGMEQGDDKDVVVSYPADYADAELAGKTKNYNVKVKNIYNNITPTLDDEFVVNMFANAPEGTEYPKTVEELKEYSKKNMQEQLNKNFEDMFKNSLLEKIVANSEIFFPEAIIESRVKDRIQQFTNYLKQNNMDISSYMQMYGLTPDMMIEEFKKTEEVELKRSLAGSEIIKAEDIKATEEEIEESIAKKAESRNSTPEAFKEMMAKNQYFSNMIEDEIISKKLMDFIIENAKITEEIFDEAKMASDQLAEAVESAE